LHASAPLSCHPVPSLQYNVMSVTFPFRLSLGFGVPVHQGCATHCLDPPCGQHVANMDDHMAVEQHSAPSLKVGSGSFRFKYPNFFPIDFPPFLRRLFFNVDRCRVQYPTILFRLQGGTRGAPRPPSSASPPLWRRCSPTASTTLRRGRSWPAPPPPPRGVCALLLKGGICVFSNTF